MTFVGRIKQTVAAPELRSHIVAVPGAQCVFEYNLVCAATAWYCDLGPAYVNNPGLHCIRTRKSSVFRERPKSCDFGYCQQLPEL